MAVLIKDPDADRLIRELATRTGESITDAVRISVAERLTRLPMEKAEYASRKRRVRQITDLIDALPRRNDEVSAEAIIGYGTLGHAG